MNSDFNPLQSKLLFTQPDRLHLQSTWNEHVPFALLLVELQSPRVIVELGTHWGVSYGAWCQAVVAAGLPTRCYAVDTWAGDAHAGRYGDDVFRNLQQHHRQYEPFSKLLRMTFDEALAQIPDGTVDLLHIDGLHFYEAVKHDFETWRPKLSERGVVLFHDTVVTQRGFGVHQLWRELSDKFPHFNFEHGYGLGVLAAGAAPPAAVGNFLATANTQPAATRALFAALGGRLQHRLEQAAWSAQNAAPGSRLRRGVRKLKSLLLGHK